MGNDLASIWKRPLCNIIHDIDSRSEECQRVLEPGEEYWPHIYLSTLSKYYSLSVIMVSNLVAFCLVPLPPYNCIGFKFPKLKLWGKYSSHNITRRTNLTSKKGCI